MENTQVSETLIPEPVDLVESQDLTVSENAENAENNDAEPTGDTTLEETNDTTAVDETVESVESADDEQVNDVVDDVPTAEDSNEDEGDEIADEDTNGFLDFYRSNQTAIRVTGVVVGSTVLIGIIGAAVRLLRR
jgi:hypothetical protein